MNRTTYYAAKAADNLRWARILGAISSLFLLAAIICIRLQQPNWVLAFLVLGFASIYGSIDAKQDAKLYRRKGGTEQ